MRAGRAKAGTSRRPVRPGTDEHDSTELSWLERAGPWRCALQVNPHHYSQTYRGEAAQGDALGYAQEIVDKAVEVGIEVLTITDHNSVDGVAAFRSASRNRPVHIFPGFELSSSEGVHLLCLYPPDASDDQLGRHLGEFGIRVTSPSTELATKTLAEILESVHSQGGG